MKKCDFIFFIFFFLRFMFLCKTNIITPYDFRRRNTHFMHFSILISIIEFYILHMLYLLCKIHIDPYTPGSKFIGLQQP